MRSILRKHIVDSRWLTLVGNGFLRSSCGLAADWASSADHWAAPSRHSLSVIKDWAAACPRTATAAQIVITGENTCPAVKQARALLHAFGIEPGMGER